MNLEMKQRLMNCCQHLSQFFLPFWSHELLFLWLLELIAKLLYKNFIAYSPTRIPNPCFHNFFRSKSSIPCPPPSWFNLRPISACLPASYSLVTFSGPLPQEVRRGTSSILAYPSLTSILAQPACLHPRFTCIRFSFLWLASCSSILTSLTEPEDSSERLKIDGGRGRLILCC